MHFKLPSKPPPSAEYLLSGLTSQKLSNLPDISFQLRLEIVKTLLKPCVKIAKNIMMMMTSII